MATLPHASRAEVYDAVYEAEYGALYRQLTDLTVDVIAGLAAPGARIVDFGAGTGRLAIPLTRGGFRVVAVDPCEPMLRRIAESAPERKIPCVVSTMQSFDADEPFDMALCVFTVVCYLLDAATLHAGFEACARVLRPGGLVLLDVPTETLFGSRAVKAPGLRRDVTITPLGEGLYDYEERLVIGRAGDRRKYRDAFRIRAWGAREVLDTCSGVPDAMRSTISGGKGQRRAVSRARSRATQPMTRSAIQ
jgi:SAM-dependent methyltransferase